jgi:hypothetical protein
MEQTTLAQGDFARTSDGLANQQRILSAQWDEMTAALGNELLPVATDFVGFLNDDMLPALGAAGGVAKDVGSAIGALPGPVKAAAGAFAALKIASAVGLGDLGVATAGKASGAFDSLRIRGLLAADAYREVRNASITAQGAGYKFYQGAGRIESSLAGIKAGATGAGSALRRGFSGALGIVGGPWGAAFIAGTAVLTHFWQESQEAKQRVDEMTDALNEQTGAITKTNKEMAFKTLQESGAIDIAKKYGIELDTLRDAALGNADAQAAVNRVMAEQKAAMLEASAGQTKASDTSQQFFIDAGRLREAIGGQNEELEASRQEWEDQREFMGKSEDATQDLEGATLGYSNSLKDARTELQKLIDAEEERRLNAVQSKRDQLALIETMKAAREEARKGRKTLDDSTEAGRNNWEALLDLADQWNNSTPKVKNARGAYADMRREFIDLAEQMGATEEGYREAMAQIEALKAEAAGFSSTVDLTPRGPGSTGNTVPDTQPSGGGRGKRGRRTGGGTSQRSGGVQVNVGNVNVTDKKSAQQWANEAAQQGAMGGWGGVG